MGIVKNYAKMWINGWELNDKSKTWWDKKEQREIEARGDRFVNVIKTEMRRLYKSEKSS